MRCKFIITVIPIRPFFVAFVEAQVDEAKKINSCTSNRLRFRDVYVSGLWQILRHHRDILR